ncbi:hypothetical protein L3X38_030120 [Prunus dulcis]|uniref:Plant thionin family protein n=2 Tax=Prunus TaxID=3754 RepID=A0AAD4V9P1_PRUDU|nr:hypothetical protein L3X38_030120 [Prunus dulcis]
MEMAYKSVAMVVVTLISAMLMTASAGGGGAGAGEGGGQKARFVTCIRDCMPLCMQIKDVTEAACDKACELGCKQLQGKGPPSRGVRLYTEGKPVNISDTSN